MAIKSPSLVELHAFLAVARSHSFRKAADELYVTQAAVSRAVARLEDELGQDLLHRSATGATLTPAGAKYRKLIEKPVAVLEAAALKVKRRPERLNLRLSVITSLGNLWLMPRLHDFHQAYPEVDIEFRQYHHDEDFTREDVDLWIDVKRDAQRRLPRQISAQYLIGKEIVAVCTKRLARNITTPQQMLSQPLLYHSNFPDNWTLWATAAAARLPLKWKGKGFDLVMNLIKAARADMGVAVVQKCMVEADIAAGTLVRPVPVSAFTDRGYYLCRRRSQSAHAATDLFVAWLMAQADQMSKL